jgi:hypothetical protein
MSTSREQWHEERLIESPLESRSRSDEFAQAMVVSALGASRGIHDSIIKPAVASTNEDNRSWKSVAVMTRIGDNPRRKLQNDMRHGTNTRLK